MSQLFLPMNLTGLREARPEDPNIATPSETITDRYHLKGVNTLQKQTRCVSGSVLWAFDMKHRSLSMPDSVPTENNDVGLLEEAQESQQAMGCKFTHLKRTRSLQPDSKEERVQDCAEEIDRAAQAAFRSHLDGQPVRQEKELELPKLIGGSKNEVLSNAKYSSRLVPQLAACLPIHRRCDDWKLLYSLAQDGCSLHTLLGKTQGQNSTLVVVETTKGDVFGGFTTEAWQSSANYYGIGESFVFTLNPRFESFPWSYLNTMLMLSNDECIAMGGGGDFAWCLNSDLSRGTSGHSATFENRCLTTEGDFNIYNVEVWGFVTKK